MADLRKLEVFADAIPAPVVLLDAGGRVSMANSQARALLGDWVRGRSYVSVLRQPAILARIEAAFYDGAPGVGTFTSAEGEVESEYRVTVTPVSEVPKQVLLHFEDTSDVSQAANQRRGFVANVSHELKTPLTALMGYIETLQGPARDDPAAQKHFLASMWREATRMNRLVSDLLSLSRVEAQERRRPSEPIDLIHCLHSAQEPLETLAKDAGVPLTISAPETAPLRGDADQLVQVFLNLGENAIKYGGGEVTVEIMDVAHDAQLRGPAWVLHVRDRGAGINPVHLPRLTERFYRVDSHRASGQGGTGLGLAIVKHIANRHRGRLKIESTAGIGSTFSVFLPRAERERSG